MFNISSFLGRFSKDISSQEDIKKTLIDIIFKHTQLNFSADSLEIKNYILNLEASPAVKNKIFIYKNAILEDIALSVTEKIIDIR